MYICKVIGKVVSTIKNDKLVGASMVMVRVVSLAPDGSRVLGNDVYAAVDSIGCGEGNLVLVTKGANARLACMDTNAPADMAVVGIIDNELVVQAD